MTAHFFCFPFAPHSIPSVNANEQRQMAKPHSLNFSRLYVASGERRTNGGGERASERTKKKNPRILLIFLFLTQLLPLYRCCLWLLASPDSCLHSHALVVVRSSIAGGNKQINNSYFIQKHFNLLKRTYTSLSRSRSPQLHYFM